MTLNTFEGGTVAATITTGNSGGASGDPFDFVQIAATGTATYINTFYRGLVAGRFSSGASAGIVHAEYTTSVDVAGAGKGYGRGRFRLPALPPDATGVRIAVIADNTGSFRMSIHISNLGKVQLRGSAGTVLASSAMTYVAGATVDVGWSVLVISATVGQTELKIYDVFGNVSETLTSAANLNTLGAGGPFRLQCGQVRSIASFTVEVDDLAYSTVTYPATPVNPAVIYGPWAGAVDDTGFTVSCRIAGTASARLVVSLAVDLSAPQFSAAVAPDADGLVKLTIGARNADTLYFYGVEADGVVLPTGRGQVRTFPTAGAPASFSIAFGSCQFTVPTDVTFAAIAARVGPFGKVRQLVHMGDMHYRDFDGTATAADILGQYMTSLGSASMAGPLAQLPIAYCIDNHDWGGDTSDATTPAGNLIGAAYRQIFPHYPLPASNGRGFYHSWVCGRVRFIQLDVRSYRSPQSDPDGPAKTMLGTEQKAWLAAELGQSEPVKVLCANYPWRDSVPGDGRWGSYPTEFTDLNATLASVAGGRVFVIFGDRHYLAADDGTGADTHGVPQAGGAPFQQASVAVGGTWSQGSYTIEPAVLQAYGILDITDAGDTITIDYSGYTSLDGTERVSMSTEFAVEIAAAGDLLLPALTTEGAGTFSANGSGEILLPAMLTDGGAAFSANASGALVLPPLSASGTAAGPGTGSGDLVLPALQAEGFGEITDGCAPWPYDTTCLPAGWPATLAGMSARQRAAYDAAQWMLSSLMPIAYGLCTLTVRPCGVGCAVDCGYRLGSGGWFWPQLRRGQVYNGCGCTARCGCDILSEIRLDGPVYDILLVRIDGVVVNPATYRVDNASRLVRTDGEVWPMVQDLNASAGMPNTFEVTYRRGALLPVLGQQALTALMVEFDKAFCGDSACQLPSRVTNIVREGVTYSMLDDPKRLLAAGMTGVRQVDLWIASANPHGTRTPMRVYSPDTARPRRQTWP